MIVPSLSIVWITCLVMFGVACVVLTGWLLVCVVCGYVCFGRMVVALCGLFAYYVMVSVCVYVTVCWG